MHIWKTTERLQVQILSLIAVYMIKCIADLFGTTMFNTILLFINAAIQTPISAIYFFWLLWLEKEEKFVSFYNKFTKNFIFSFDK